MFIQVRNLTQPEINRTIYYLYEYQKNIDKLPDTKVSKENTIRDIREIIDKLYELQLSE